MTKLQPVGFFRELPHGSEDGPSLKALVSDRPQDDEEEIVRYLRDGILFVVCPGVVDDALDPSAGTIGAPHLLTDTSWAWPNDLAYYVQKYHVKLPGEFVAHMKAHNWRVPDEAEIDLEALEVDW